MWVEKIRERRGRERYLGDGTDHGTMGARGMSSGSVANRKARGVVRNGSGGNALVGLRVNFVCETLTRAESGLDF